MQFFRTGNRSLSLVGEGRVKVGENCHASAVQEMCPWNEEVLLRDWHDIPLNFIVPHCFYVFNWKTGKVEFVGRARRKIGAWTFFLQSDILRDYQPE